MLLHSFLFKPKAKEKRGSSEERIKNWKKLDYNKLDCTYLHWGFYLKTVSCGQKIHTYNMCMAVLTPERKHVLLCSIAALKCNAAMCKSLSAFWKEIDPTRVQKY